jgi:outer membrane protein OmpA-like peptidoglycan-associated protein
MNTRIITLAALVATLSACSSTPDRNLALEQAHARFNIAQNDPKVTTLAAEELKQAGESLGVADKAWKDHEKTDTVNHLSYMTSQRVIIAQETASSKDAQAVTAGAAAERNETRLALRTDEADAAKQQLTLEQQSNAQKTNELAAADAAALRNRDRVGQRDARISDLETQLKDLNAKQTERGLIVTLGDVLFNTGKWELLSGAEQNMDKLAEFFKHNPQNKASIEGYTDSVGGAKANVSLSHRRALAVKNALVERGVSSHQLSTKAYGASNPVASNATATGRQMNRRVEIVIAP